MLAKQNSQQICRKGTDHLDEEGMAEGGAQLMAVTTAIILAIGTYVSIEAKSLIVATGS